MRVMIEFTNERSAPVKLKKRLEGLYCVQPPTFDGADVGGSRNAFQACFSFSVNDKSVVTFYQLQDGVPAIWVECEVVKSFAWGIVSEVSGVGTTRNMSALVLTTSPVSVC
jgi:hypothetical protein